MRAAWGVLLLCVACDGGSSDGASSSSSGSAQASTSTGTTTIIASTSSEGSSTTEAAPEYAPPLPTCRKECDFAADCCPAGLEPCPTQEFPSNFGCVDGMCVPAPCESDAQCESMTPGSTCHDVDGVAQCVVLCDGDEACSGLGSGFACGGTTSDAQSYCRERCDLGTPCVLDTCNPDGVCVCESDDQCINGFTCDVDAGA